MKIIDLINQKDTTPFSFEVLPPLKGEGTERLYETLDCLREFEPRYVNITAHRSEYVYREREDGLMERLRLRRRPGSIAIAAAIQKRYGLPVVPHLVSGGNTREDLEYMLIDLQFLGISDLLVLRGDKAKDEPVFKPTGDGPAHATELIEQVNRFNAGEFWDGSPIRCPGEPFTFGVACYPEKHEEAPNPTADLEVLARKVSMGAQYAVTQLFFDNERYFDFTRRAREAGIEVPIVPGIKPLSKLSQLSVLPKTFHCDLPDALYNEARHCKTNEEVKRLGIEWGVEQCRELLKAGVPNIHFYTVGATDSVRQIAKQIY
ncbi:MAG: methylenetetrahydrofolate reductase [NAD(P)H] [Prevotellaceae bacterium]|nr:methylenetetrahydrofolate reductase [NAD(P)H] [Prevotellaceae bacterium]